MKWALILGASGGIGQNIAYDLAKKGWSLYLHYYQNETKLMNLQGRLQAEYPKQDFLSIHYDLCDSHHLEQITTNIFSLDAVIFTQGTTYYGLFHDLKAEQLATLWQMQVQTPLLLLQKLEEKLARSGQGRIVFIGSVYGGAGSAMEVAYSTVKGALSAFALAYSKEVASLGITVNVVAPGAVDTQMNQVFSKADKDSVSAEIPTGRFAAPTEISYWVSALLAQKAGYLTGQTIYVSGGWLK
ncbi:3-oxoacyl-[acyl-carrier-protein] reductase [Ligilactobacillus agilis DSM 20509]|uniref:3-oxoacyl-[acyl-carrier-protein] reductase n=1 Tax=Ligilactobacillus agilis DSM 20509 TaxID=1423718 RepID=A0A0R2AKK1_9LACO|nr:SDR family NAD(P)-dependent oxidoreductase [Ligilactobacillus agilis]KRM63548.1 3-oxoacyl-[acyl-carrier-protein] reductase [Ligilactobacillus agilis DSM 20509]